MFHFENKHYQDLLENSSRGRYAKRNKEAVQDFAEVVENLELFEVSFIKALRACERSFKVEFKTAFAMYHHSRLEIYRLLSIMFAAESCIKGIAQPARGFPTETPEEGGPGETPLSQSKT